MTDQYAPALRQRFLEDMRINGLQPKTQTMYLRAMRDFTRYLGHSPDSATPEELRAFQLDMKERGVGAPTFNNRLTVLSFLFATTCPRPEMKRHMRYQRAAKKIPVVLSAEEVARILEAAPGPGLRYRAAFSVAHGGGLRASEVTHLKVGDIDSDRMLIRVDQGKGRKDRHVMLSPSLLELLRDYYREARPAGWLFPGRNRVDPISTRQFNRAFGVACDFSRAHPLAMRADLRLRDCVEYNLVLPSRQYGVRVLLDLAARRLGRTLEPVLETDSFDMVRHFAAYGHSIGFQIPVGLNALARPDMAFVPLAAQDVAGGELFPGHLRGRTLPVAALKFARQAALALDRSRAMPGGDGTPEGPRMDT